MEEALDFYCQKLGFEVASHDFFPCLVPLKHDGIHLVLSYVEQPCPVEYGKTAQSLINFQTDDLEKTITELKKKGVMFIHDKPQDCPVGVFAAFKDPSGNVHELVEFR